MRRSQILVPTLKENPADAEVISHRLMLRAGLIRKLASGLYTWLPLGLRVLRKVEAIVRDEMNKAGAQEVLMPAVQPAELWHESERWDQFGPELLRFHDRHQRDFCYGPTHEEVITDLIRNEIQSYKELPACFYQIQTKFRDEVRPRFGIMRAREFLMKDAYSFHADDNSLQEMYERMYTAYSNIFSRLGLNFRAVKADTGSIGGKASHEFHVLAASGEDVIAYSDKSDYAANIELAEALTVTTDDKDSTEQSLSKVDTPEQHSIAEVSAFLNVPETRCLKTLIVKGAEEGVVALVVRGDHELNEVKAEHLPQVQAPLVFASDDEIRQACQASAGSVGPVGLTIPVIVDRSAAEVQNFVCGANEDGKHLTGVNWQRDVETFTVADIRNVVEGDPSPDGQGQLALMRGIEVGHIFQLGTKYSEAMNANCLNESGKAITMTMGCYGIGVSRVVASAIEQNNDDNGIIWPEALSPFQITLIPLNMHRSETVAAAAEKLYTQLTQAGYEVLFEDRNERAGFLFADADLIGIPHRIIVGDRALKNGQVEYKSRKTGEAELIDVDHVLRFMQERISG